MEDILIKSNKTPPWQFLLFFFFSVYFFLYIFPFPVGYNGNLGLLSNAYYKGFNALILWVGHVVFHRSLINIIDNGSGDRFFNYMQAFTMALLALIVIAVWYLFTKRKNATRVLSWVYIYIQLYLSITLIRYGLEKVIKVQFPFPYYGLNETYADSSPLRLLVNFMGYSTVYNVFTGVVEVMAGLLVLFRKTVLMGAILATGALGNIVMMNIGYDVPVKLHVLNLLLMAVFMATPFAWRLRNLFISDKIHNSSGSFLYLYDGKTAKLIKGGKILFAVFLIYSNLQNTRLKYSTYGDGAFQATPLFGIYQVKTFIKNKDTLPPLITDTSQWKTLSIVYKKRATLKMMNDTTKLCRIITDTSKKTITLTSQEDTTYQANFTYRQPDATHLLLSGKVKKDSVIMWLEKQDMGKFRLINHEFHWIHESLDTR